MSASTNEPSGWLIAPCGTPHSYSSILTQARNIIGAVATSGITDTMLENALLSALAEMDEKAPNTSITEITLTNSNHFGRAIYYSNQDPHFLRPRLIYFRGEFIHDWHFIPNFSADSYSAIIILNSENINVPLDGEVLRMWYDRRNALAGLNGQYTTVHPAGMDVLACGTAFYAVLNAYQTRAFAPGAQATSRIHAVGASAKMLGSHWRTGLAMLSKIQSIQTKNWDFQGMP